MIADEIRDFIRNPESGDFNRLAARAFRFQYERLEPYRRLCRRVHLEPATVEDWRQIPLVPTLAYKSLDLATADSGEVFRSSGSTGSQRSVHRHGFLDLYRETIDRSFPDAVLGPHRSLPILSLIPTRQQAADSSLSFMTEHVVALWGEAGSVHALTDRGVDSRSVRRFLAAAQRNRRPTLILGTSFALVALSETLDRLGLRFRLSPGSVVFETGGYKGRSRELSRAELEASLARSLAIYANQIVREYGMTELTSQFYTGVRHGGDPDLFLPPHWTRVRVLDPRELTELPAGRTGLIAIFDLANLSSAVHLLTQDLGVADGAGFRLLGRAAGAELRGCSLTVEQIVGS